MTDAYEKDLEAAFQAARRALKKKPTGENAAESERLRKLLAAHRAEKAAAADPANRRFKTQAEVLEYLNAEGWKIGKTKLSEDWRLIPRQKDGTVLVGDADEYARLKLGRLDNSEEAAAEEAKKIDWETKIAEEKHRKLKKENEITDGRYVLKSEVSRMLASRAAALMNGLGPEFIHAEAPAVVKLVGGQAERIPDLIDYWLETVEKHFDRYSRPLDLAVPAGADVPSTDEEDTL